MNYHGDEGVMRLTAEGRAGTVWQVWAGMTKRRGGREPCMSDVRSDLWAAVDGFIEDAFVREDEALRSALTRSAEAGLPAIQVSPAQGKLLQLMALAIGARRILEIGTLGGYSTIWMARALPPDGRLISLEFSAKHAEAAKGNLAAAGLAGVTEVIVGRAIDSLPTLAGRGPFDLVFIDADKPGTAAYFDWAIRLSRPGGVIIVDNVVRGGEVLDRNQADEAARGMQAFYDAASRERRVRMTAIQTVGAKGYDGFAMAVVHGGE